MDLENNGQLVIMKPYGCLYLSAVCFLFSCVVCCLQVMNSALQSSWNGRHSAFIKLEFCAALDGMRNGGQWMASIRRSFQFYEAKFSASKAILGCRRKKAITSMCVCLRSRFRNKAVCHLL
jgi:hypothetical protein